MAYAVNSYILSQLFEYVKDTVNQDAVLSREILFREFEEKTSISLGGKRQRLRYLAALKNACCNSEIHFIRGYARRGKKLYITSENKSHFVDYDKEAFYSKILLQALKAKKATDVKVYEILIANTKTNKKYLEKVVRSLKTEAEQCGLVYFYIGRHLHVRLKKCRKQKN